MRVLHQFASDPHTCHYLCDRQATLHYSLAPNMTANEYEDLMNKGYRKFGAIFFRPICGACTACRPIRVPIATFHPNRSQRRAMKCNEDLEIRCAPASVDEARIDLYRRYHDSQSDRKGWPDHPGDADEYTFSYVKNPVPNMEISVWERDKLRAVILNDITPRTVSAIYHYHDPECLDRSLGTFSVLQSLELARRLKKTWLYLGYYVSGCGSLSYKSNFRPCELMDEQGHWSLMSS
jgi:arginine-tRNA-protein transferase